MKSKKNYFWLTFTLAFLALFTMPLANVQAQIIPVHKIDQGIGLDGQDLTNTSLAAKFPGPLGFAIDAIGGLVGVSANVTIDDYYVTTTGEITFGTIGLSGGNALTTFDGGNLIFTADTTAGTITNTMVVKASSVTLSTGKSDALGGEGAGIEAYFHTLVTGDIDLSALNTDFLAKFEATVLNAGNVTINMGNESDNYLANTNAEFTVHGDADERLTMANLNVNANVGLGSATADITLNDADKGGSGVEIGDITVDLNSTITDPNALGLSTTPSAITINIETDTATAASNIGAISLNANHENGDVKLVLNDAATAVGELLTVKSIEATAQNAISDKNAVTIELGGMNVLVTGDIKAATLADDAAIIPPDTIFGSTAKISLNQAKEIEIGGAILAEAKTVTAGAGKALSEIEFSASENFKSGAVTATADAISTAAAAPSALLVDSKILIQGDIEIGTVEVNAKADSLFAPTSVLSNAKFNAGSVNNAAIIGGDLNVKAEFNNQSTTAANLNVATAEAFFGGAYSATSLEVAGNINITAKATEVGATDSGAKAEITVSGLEAVVKGGEVNVESIGKATARATFHKGLDFSYSSGGNILVATDDTAPNDFARVVIDGPLSLSGGNANSIVVNNADFVHSSITKLIVGNEFAVNNAGTTLSLDLAKSLSSGPIASVTEIDFYTSGAGVGDTILTVSGLDTTTDVLDLNSLAADKVGVGLAGNKLKVGESLILIAKNDFVTPAATEIAVDTAIANVLNSNGIYLDTDYTIEWLIDGALTLKLGANAKSEEKGVLGGETNSLFFDDLKATGSTPGTNGSVDSLTDADWADFYNKVEADANHPYNSLTKNAKKLYYNLAHIPTFAVATATEYDWVGTDNRSLDFRQAISDYFGNIIPDFVTASAGAFTKDDLIAQFMNTLDPQVYVNSGAFIANTINKNFNTALSRMATSDRTMAYWQAVAAGDNNTDWTIWAQTNIAWENFRDDGDYMGFTSNSYFGYLGADRRFDDFRIGLAGSFGNTELDWNAYGAETDADSFLIKVYAEYDPNDLIVGLAIGAGNISAETQRYTGAGVLGKNKADYDISLFTVDAYVGYRLYTSNLEFLPKASLSYLHSKQDAIKEKGNVPLNLGSVENDSLVGALSVEIKAPLKLEAGHIIKPKIKFGISQEFGDASNTLRTAFPGQAGVAMDSEGLKKKRTSLDVGVGVEAYLNNGVNLFAEYDAEIQSKYNNQSVSLGLEYKF